jgi:hypothetical protein
MLKNTGWLNQHFKSIFNGLLIFAVIQPAVSQVPDFSKVPNLWDNDSVNIVNLIDHGVNISRQRVVCWFPADSLSTQQMDHIADTINAGVSAAEHFIHAPLPWQKHRYDDPYVFYFRTDSFISHASGADFVSIPFWRIKQGRAPWLHEAIHEMLNTISGDWQDTTKVSESNWKANMPLWLFEGLADYISLEVSRLNHLPWYDVFSRKLQTNADSLFLSDIRHRSDTPTYILSFIGHKGAMPQLFSEERGLYSPTFYHGSCSFVKYISEQYSLSVLLSAVSLFQQEEETIERSCGQPVETLKQQWLQSLGVLN